VAGGAREAVPGEAGKREDEKGRCPLTFSGACERTLAWLRNKGGGLKGWRLRCQIGQGGRN